MATALLIALGLCFASVPFLFSLAPSEGAEDRLPHIDISALSSGRLLVVDAPAAKPFSRRFYVFRDPEGRLGVFVVPTKDSAVVLPDMHWWRMGALCNDFGPTLHDDEIASDSIITCRDTTPPSWVHDESRWDLTGHNLGLATDDLIVPRHVVEGRVLIIGKGA